MQESVAEPVKYEEAIQYIQEPELSKAEEGKAPEDPFVEPPADIEMKDEEENLAYSSQTSQSVLVQTAPVVV